MGRLFLLLMCVLGGALYFPETRVRLVERVEPLLGPVLSPLKISSTKDEMRYIARDLQEHERIYRKVPKDATSFQSWLMGRYAAEDNYLDSWGNVYEYQLWPDSFAIRSRGPDERVHTVDDLSENRGRIPRKDRRN